MEIGFGMAVSSICSADAAHPRNVEVMTIPPDAGSGQIWSSNNEVTKSTAGSSTNHSAMRSGAHRPFHGTLLGRCQLRPFYYLFVIGIAVSVELKISVFATALGF